VNVTFFGVRGSTPCSSPRLARYGGNTSSVVVDVPNTPPLLLDLGTGVRLYGDTIPAERRFEAVALVSHLHWDHVQGLPFFTPALRPGNRLQIFAPAPGDGRSLQEAVDTCLCPPFFPVSLKDLRGEISFVECEHAEIEVGNAVVRAALVPHNGPTLGFRIDAGGRSVGYLPDHQQPMDGSFGVDPAVCDLFAGVDLLIHDAQYTQDEFRAKRDWGHSTIEYAVEVACAVGAKSLALFHHDPSHCDEIIDHLATVARHARGCRRLDVFAAREGLSVDLAAR
jgi:phosphoribosyl 1,2-cyclic phosphodiesterase